MDTVIVITSIVIILFLVVVIVRLSTKYEYMKYMYDTVSVWNDGNAERVRKLQDENERLEGDIRELRKQNEATEMRIKQLKIKS